MTDFVTANEQDTGPTENPFRKEAIDHRKLITTTDIAFEDITSTLVALSGRPVPRAYVGEPVVDALTCEIDYHDIDLSVSREHREDVAGEVSDSHYNLGYADIVKENDS